MTFSHFSFLYWTQNSSNTNLNRKTIRSGYLGLPSFPMVLWCCPSVSPQVRISSPACSNVHRQQGFPSLKWSENRLLLLVQNAPFVKGKMSGKKREKAAWQASARPASEALPFARSNLFQQPLCHRARRLATRITSYKQRELIDRRRIVVVLPGRRSVNILYTLESAAQGFPLVSGPRSGMQDLCLNRKASPPPMPGCRGLPFPLTFWAPQT